MSVTVRSIWAAALCCAVMTGCDDSAVVVEEGGTNAMGSAPHGNLGRGCEGVRKIGKTGLACFPNLSTCPPLI